MEEGEGSEVQEKWKVQLNEKDVKSTLEQKGKEHLAIGTIDQEPGTEEMALGDLDLDSIEKACDNLNEGYIPFE